MWNCVFLQNSVTDVRYAILSINTLEVSTSNLLLVLCILERVVNTHAEHLIL